MRDDRGIPQTSGDSEYLLRHAIANVPAVVWSTDCELRFTSVRGLGVSWLNLRPDEVVGVALSDYFQTDDPNFIALAAHRRAVEGESVSYEQEWMGRVYHTSLSPLRDGEGEILGCVGVAHDVTEQKRVEQALKDSEARYHAFFEQAPDSIVLLDPETHTLAEFNDRAHQTLGYTREEFEKLVVSDYEVVESAREVARHTDKIVEEGADTFETRHRSKDGEIRHVHVNAKTISVRGKKYIQAIWRDITRQKRVEELLRVQRDLGVRLNSMLDLNTALELCLDAALRGSSTDCGAIYLRNDDGSLDLGAHSGLSADFVSKMSRCDADSPHARLVAGATAVYTEHAKLPLPLRDDGSNPEGMLAMAILPVCHEGKAVACLNVASRTAAEIPVVVRSALEIIASQIASAIVRIRAQEALKQSRDELEERVRERTAELAIANLELRKEIAERKQAEETLRRSEQTVRLLLDAPLDTAILLIDREGTVLALNRYVADHLGNRTDELVGRCVYDFYPPEITAFRKARAEEAFRSKRNIRFEEGRAGIAFETTCSPVFNDKGEVQHIAVFARDVTEHKRAEEALRESEERHRMLVEKMNDGFAVVDENMRLTFANDKLCQMLGFAHRELIGRHPLDFCDDANQPIFRGHSSKRRRGGEDTYEIAFTKKGGQHLFVIVSPKPLFDAEGVFQGSFAVITDITERKQAEEALRRAQRLASVGTLAAGIAHEINNPLHGIVLYAETALRCKNQPDPHETRQEYLRNIQAEALRCGRIVKGVLQFARQETSEKWPNRLGAVARRARDLTRRLAVESRVSVELEPGDDTAEVLLNPIEMEQVLVNLISNAIQASKPGDCVSVRVEPADGAARVVVEDHGRGMTEEQRSRAFDPFYTTRLQQGGTGLGLSLSYGIVREHGGTIDVQSAPGEGTTISVVLPINPTPPQ